VARHDSVLRQGNSVEIWENGYSSLKIEGGGIVILQRGTSLFAIVGEKGSNCTQRRCVRCNHLLSHIGGGVVFARRKAKGSKV
jgi:hypothetical protein